MCRQDGPRDDTSAPKRKPPKPRSNKQKGRQFEFWVRRAVSEALGIDPDSLNLRGAGAPGCDMWPSPDVKDRFPFCVEAKARRKLSLFEAMRQCEGNTYAGHLPVVLSTYRGKTLATVPVELFLAMVRAIRMAYGCWPDDVAEFAESLKMDLPRVSGATFEDKPARRKEAVPI